MVTDRPEVELLLQCARTSRSPRRAEQIRALLLEEIDWEYLLEMASRHRMVPLLFWHLGAVGTQGVPKDILDQLQEHCRENTRRNLFLTGELLRLLNHFEARGIPAVPFKGPALAAFTYGNLALREFADLDILVHKWDIARAKELLISVGYRPDYQLPRTQEAASIQSVHSHAFTRDDGKNVDLHWAITERYFAFPLDPECLWRRLERISLGGTVLLTFSPEDLLLILCVHGSKHLWARLSWICDVAELVRTHKKMDWEQVMKQATELGSERMLILGLFLASDLLGVTLPERVLHRVQSDPVVKTLAGEVREHLFWETNNPLGDLEEFPFHPFHLRVRERLQDRIRYCISLAMTPTVRDWLLLPLPAYLSPLYYVIRPVRLAGKHGRRIIKRFV